MVNYHFWIHGIVIEKGEAREVVVPSPVKSPVVQKPKTPKKPKDTGDDFGDI